MKCPVCRLPVNMDFPVLGRIIYRHLNKIARRESGRMRASAAAHEG